MHAINRHQNYLTITNERNDLLNLIDAMRSGEMDALISDSSKKILRLQDEKLIQENESLLKKMEHLANYDHLTHLPNRLYFEKNLDSTLTHAAHNNKKFAVIIIDLDHFKVVNDTRGHYLGDLLLEAMGKRVQACMRKTDFFARIGGDEFGVIVPAIDDVTTAGKIAGKLLTVVKEPFILQGIEIYITLSIGIACYPVDGLTTLDLLKHADIALYRVKESGRSNYQYFQSELDKLQKRHLVIESVLYNALENKELYLVYQPIIRLDTKEVVAMEALIRWHSDELGDVLPNEFIPIAESSSIIVHISKWVLNEVCQQQSRWEKENKEMVPICINLSSIDLLQDDLAGVLGYIEMLLKIFKCVYT